MQRRQERRLVVACGLGGLAIATGTWLWLQLAATLPGELRAVSELRGLWGRSVPVQHVVQFMADLGTPPVAVATVLIAAAILLRNVGWRAAVLLLVAACVVFLAEGAKHVVGLPSSPLRHGGGGGPGGFPSGHTAYTTAVFGCLAALGWWSGRKEVVAVMAGLIALMGPAMVMREAHLPGDVIAGYGLGGAWLCMALLGYGYAQDSRD